MLILVRTKDLQVNKHMNVREEFMTKEALRKNLEAGKMMDDLFHYSAGQQCTIYKAAAFTTGDEIIYIPDISLNDIPMDRPLRNGEEIEEVLSVCYAGVDFVQECAGDVKLAERLFYYCDWQHPSSALPEVDCEDEVI